MFTSKFFNSFFVCCFLLWLALPFTKTYAQGQNSTDRQEEVIRNNAALGYNQLAIIQQVGNQNNITISQIGGQKNVARALQNGAGNHGTISIVSGFENAVLLNQDGLGNRGRIALSNSRESQIDVSQQGSMNALGLSIGRAQGLDIGITQKGNGYIEIDVPRYDRFSGINLNGMRITQENGGVPIIIKPGSTLNLPVSQPPSGN